MGNCSPEHNGEPYQAPCNGWHARKKGPCFSHKRRSEMAVPIYNNTLRVANWRCADEGGGGLIVPYHREVDLYSHGCGADDGHGNYTSYSPPYPPLDATQRAATYCHSGHQSHLNPPCATSNSGWNLDQNDINREFNRVVSSLCIDFNCYQRDPGLGTVDLSKCQKTGFKNAQARKEWHGRWGYTHDDPWSSLHCDVYVGGVLHSVTPRVGPTSGPDQTKYRMIEVTVRDGIHDTYAYNVYSPDPLPPYTWPCPEVTCLPSGGYPNACVTHHEDELIYRSAIIDRYSGVITYGDNAAVATSLQDTYIGEANGATVASMASLWSTMVAVTPGFGQTALYGNALTNPADFRSDPTGWPTARVGYFKLKDDATGRVLATNHIDLDAGQMEVRTYDTQENPSSAEIYRWTATDYSHESLQYETWMAMQDTVLGSDGYGSCVVLTTPDDGTPFYSVPQIVRGWSVVAHLSVPYTGSEVQADVVSLLCNCDLSNDTVYPWRTDLFPTVAPLMSYNSYTSSRNVVTGDVGAVDSGGGTFDGSVLGKMFALGWPQFDGLGGAFDPRHMTYKPQAVDGGGYVLAKTAFGAFSGGSGALDQTDGVVPATATQWTDNNVASQFVPGAWMKMFNQEYEGGGYQGILWAQKWAECLMPWRSQNWFGPCGVDRDAISSTGCAYVGGHCVQQGVTHYWPNAWAIEGDRRYGIDGTDAAKGILGAPAEYLRVGDLVDFTDESGDTVDDNSGAGYGVTEVGSGYFKLGAAIPAGFVRVKSHGAPHYKWYDSDRKGSFVKVGSTFNERGFYYSVADEYATSTGEDCLAFDPCNPAVICYSPNYDALSESTIDKFTNGKTYGFGAVTVDNRFGCEWQGRFIQTMRDVWYKDPVKPCVDQGDESNCDSYCVWREAPDDNGLLCPEDTCVEEPDIPGQVKYFAFHRVVEAKLAPPVGAPSSPAPVLSLNTAPLSVPDQAWDITTGAPTTPALELAPWALYNALQSCICGGGRFAANYKLMLACWACGEEVGI